MIGTVCRHGSAPHLLPLGARVNAASPTLAEVIAGVLSHAPGDEVSDEERDAVRRLLANLPPAVGPGWVAVTDEQRNLLSRVLGAACAYMDANGFADDPEFPEDRYAADLLGPTGGIALTCGSVTSWSSSAC